MIDLAVWVVFFFLPPHSKKDLKSIRQPVRNVLWTFFLMWNSKVLFMRCSRSPCKFGLTARFLYNVKYSVTILLGPCSRDTSWIIHGAASCRVQMYNVSANSSYLMSSLMLDASFCHARILFRSLLCPDKRDSHRTIRVKLSQRTAPPLHHAGRKYNSSRARNTTVIERVCCWNNKQLLTVPPHWTLLLSLCLFSIFFKGFDLLVGVVFRSSNLIFISVFVSVFSQK